MRLRCVVLFAADHLKTLLSSQQSSQDGEAVHVPVSILLKISMLIVEALGLVAAIPPTRPMVTVPDRVSLVPNFFTTTLTT
jgi:hypothetical protein